MDEGREGGEEGKNKVVIDTVDYFCMRRGNRKGEREGGKEEKK